MSILPSIIFNSLILSHPFQQITADLLERFSWDMLTSAAPRTIRLIINAAVTLLFLSIASLLKKIRNFIKPAFALQNSACVLIYQPKYEILFNIIKWLFSPDECR